MLIVLADGALLHHSELGDNTSAVYDKKLKTELNKAGTFEFTMPPTHVLYDAIQRFKTKIQVVQDGVLLFDGRVLETTENLNGEKQVYCEGNLAYLLDSIAEPYKGTTTVSAYLAKRIQEHNSQVEEDKRFTLRNVDSEIGAKEIDVNTTSYRQTRNDLDDVIIDVYGGYLVTDNQNGTLYLDYKKTIDTPGDQPLEFGFNIMEFSKNTQSTDVYTILLPTGDDGITIETVNEGSKYIENPNLIARYGRIYHQEDFNGVTTPAELFTEAVDYFSRVSQSILTSTFEIQVADISNISDIYDPFIVGKTYRLLCPSGEYYDYQAVTIDYDLDDMGNTSIEFADPIAQELSLNRKRSMGSTASSKRTGSGGTSSGINLKYYHEGLNSAKIIANDIGFESNSTHVAVKDKFSVIASEKDYADFIKDGGVGSILEVTPSTFRSITGLLENAFGRFKGADGTAILQNMDNITTFAGNFTADSQGVVRLKEGSSLQVSKNGIYGTVGTVTEINAVGDRVHQIEGSTLWQTRDNITAATGVLQVDQNGKLHIVDGSGLLIDKGQASFGVYDSDSLTAGVIVNKVNGGSVSINASKINLNGQTIADVISANSASITDITSNGLTNVNHIIASAGVFDSLSVDGDSLEWHTLNWNMSGGMTSTSVISYRNISLGHYHSLTVDSSTGTVTLGGPTMTQPTFNIADTTFYQQAVSAAFTRGYTAGADDARPDDASITTNATSPTGAGNAWYSTVTIAITKNGETLSTYPDKYVNVTAPYSAGANSVNLSESWNGATYTVSTTGQTTAHSASITLSATSAIVYNSSTHTYSAGATAEAGGATRAYDATPAESGTEAYQAGVTDGEGNVTITTVVPGTQSGPDASNIYTVPISVTASNGATGSGTATVDASDSYIAGADSITLSEGWSGTTYTVSTVGQSSGHGHSESTTISNAGYWGSGGNAYSYYIRIQDENGTNRISTSTNVPNNLRASSVGMSSTIAKNSQSYNSSNGNFTVNVTASATNGAEQSYNVTVTGTEAYNAGWNACRAKALESSERLRVVDATETVYDEWGNRYTALTASHYANFYTIPAAK